MDWKIEYGLGNYMCIKTGKLSMDWNLSMDWILKCVLKQIMD